MRKVLHIASGDLWGGAEAVVHCLARQQQRSAPGSVACVVMNTGRLASALAQEGIPVAALDETQHTTTALVRAVADALRRWECDVLHSHRQKEHFVAALAARRRGAAADRPALVATVHGMPENSKSKDRLRRILVNAAQHSALRYGFDAIVGVSEDITDRIRPRYPRAEVVCVHNGIDIDGGHAMTKAHDLARPLTRRRRSTAEPLRLLALGRLVPIKRFDRLQEIADCVTKRSGVRPEITLAGDGPLENELRALLRPEMANSGFRMPGFVADTASALEASDALIVTSDHEGIPMAVLEALAAGRPVFAFRVGGLPEIARHSSALTLVEPYDCGAMADAIVNQLTACDSPHLNSLPADWPFDIRQCAASYAKVYERAVARVRGAR